MLIDNILQKEKINKGWSNDTKYCITDTIRNKYLLRISPMEQYDRKKHEFNQMQKVADLGVPICFPLEFGILNESVYSIQSWIEGKDAEGIISNMDNQKQYDYGYQAGLYLKAIHSLPASQSSECWDTFFNRKIDMKIKNYLECPLKYDNGELFIEFINNHRHLLKSRPITYQHGDYHVGNMMIDSDGKLIVIDFNRNGEGDPWEDFNRISWCVQESHLFATGMLDGYFNKNVPLEFWELLAVYMCVNTVSSLPWSIAFGEQEIETMRHQANEVLAWYNNMNCVIPSWYIENYKDNK